MTVEPREEINSLDSLDSLDPIDSTRPGWQPAHPCRLSFIILRNPSMLREKRLLDIKTLPAPSNQKIFLEKSKIFDGLFPTQTTKE